MKKHTEHVNKRVLTVCSDYNCNNCSMNVTICTSCASGYYLYSDICKQCLYNCEDCSANQSSCNKCQQGYELQYKKYCSSCSSEGCSTCSPITNSNNSICLSCFNTQDFLFYDNNCVYSNYQVSLNGYTYNQNYSLYI
jgi:hypothetical protein